MLLYYGMSRGSKENVVYCILHFWLWLIRIQLIPFPIYSNQRKYTKMTSRGVYDTPANLGFVIHPMISLHKLIRAFIYLYAVSLYFNSPLLLLFKKTQFCKVCTRRMLRFTRNMFARLFRSHQVLPINQKSLSVLKSYSQQFINTSIIDGILPRWPYPPCLRMADRALLEGYPRIEACLYLYWGWTRS